MSDQQSDQQMIDQLHAGIDALLLGKDADVLLSNPAVAELLAVAVKLRTLPRASFKANLQAVLLRETPSRTDSDMAAGTHDLPQRIANRARLTNLPSDLLPTVAVPDHSLYPVQRRSFMTSLAAHALVLALLITSGIWAAPSLREKTRVSSSVVLDIGSYVLPPAVDRAGGGGGGGDYDVLRASKGNPPRFAREQITPPAIVVRNEDPKLKAEPTVVGPPVLSFSIERHQHERRNRLWQTGRRRHRHRARCRRRMGRRDRPRSVRGRRRSKCPASYLRSRTRLL